MFAVLVAGRLVQTDEHQIDERKVVFDLGDLTDANHIVVFMTGQVPFPDGFGGAIYLNLPCATGEPNWLFLGHLTNQKPSSVYRISGLKRDSSGPSSIFVSSLLPATAQPHHAQLGISIDPLQDLIQQTPIPGSNSVPPATLTEFCQKMLQTFYNYSSSFAQSRADLAQSMSSEQYVPLATLDKWFLEFKAKLALDPNFWKS